MRHKKKVSRSYAKKTQSYTEEESYRSSDQSRLYQWSIRILWLLLAGLLVITGIVALERQFWVADFLVSFRPIFALAALALCLLTFTTKQRRMQILAALLLCVNGFDLLPYYWPHPAVDTSNLRLLLYNADRNYLPYAGIESIVAMIEEEQPQVAVLLEIGEVQATALIEALQDHYPHHLEHQDTETDGFLILSQLPLGSAEPTSIGGGRMAARFTIDIDGNTVQLVSPHPTNPLWSLDERNDQVAALAEWVATADKPLIVAGDLNITMWARNYKAIEHAGVTNTRRGRGVLPTWHSPVPFMTLPIDHVLVSPEIGVHALQVMPSLGSDHLPQVVDLAVPLNSR